MDFLYGAYNYPTDPYDYFQPLRDFKSAWTVSLSYAYSPIRFWRYKLLTMEPRPFSPCGSFGASSGS
jgi:hypothetical protein